MSTSATAAGLLILSDPEYDTLALTVAEVHTMAQGAPADLCRALHDLHAAWVGPLFHTPRFAVDRTVAVEGPAPEHRRGLARILRLLTAAAQSTAHPDAMVFSVAATTAGELADRLDEVTR